MDALLKCLKLCEYLTVLISIFFSGFSGVIYEVLWNRYLAILLGAEARATTLTLAVFMSGMALGYLFFGRVIQRKKFNPILGFIWLELGIAAWGFLLPYLFQKSFLNFSSVYGYFGLNFFGIDVFTALAFIGVPSFLMGGTLPMLTLGLTKGMPTLSRSLAFIYGLHTVAASVGGLLAGYFLIPELGLVNTSRVAASMNLVAVFAALKYVKFGINWPKKFIEVKFTLEKLENSASFSLLWVVVLLSGFYITTLEAVLIRLLGLSAGASQHHFALVISVFVFSLGVGSLMAKKMGSYSATRLVTIQLCACLSLLILFLSVNYWPYTMHLIRILLPIKGVGYFLFELLLGGFILFLFIIPISLCGLVTPISFHLSGKDSENLGRLLGNLFFINMLGCALGAVIGGYFLFNYFNLDQIFKFCILLSLLGALITLFSVVKRELKWNFHLVLTVLVLFAIIQAPPFIKHRFFNYSGKAHLLPISLLGAAEYEKKVKLNAQTLFYKDSPDQSLFIGSLERNSIENSRFIIMNGISDGDTNLDYRFTSLLGLIPGLLASSIDRALVVGLGPGITTGTVAKFNELKSIDVAELSGDLIKQSYLFDAYNGGVSKNPKIKMHQMDGFRFLLGTDKKFNLIISAPSHPHIVGVENLFSREFYQLANRRLENRGVFFQWLNLYSMTDDIVQKIIGTLQSEFRFVSVFDLGDMNIGLYASNSAIDFNVHTIAEKRLSNNPKIQIQLALVSIKNIKALLELETISSIEMPKVKGVSLYSIEKPTLNQEAGLAYFKESTVSLSDFKSSTMKSWVSNP